jgi:hypothetical protein
MTMEWVTRKASTVELLPQVEARASSTRKAEAELARERAVREATAGASRVREKDMADTGGRARLGTG